MNNSIKNDLDKADRLLAQSITVPDAGDLAQRIIISSKSVPQDTSEPVSSAMSLKSFINIFRGELFSPRSLMMPGVVACLMLVLVSGIWYSPLSSNTRTPTMIQANAEEVDSLGEKFSWDSLLLMQDELAFAEL